MQCHSSVLFIFASSLYIYFQIKVLDMCDSASILLQWHFQVFEGEKELSATYWSSTY